MGCAVADVVLAYGCVDGSASAGYTVGGVRCVEYGEGLAMVSWAGYGDEL